MMSITKYAWHRSENTQSNMLKDSAELQEAHEPPGSGELKVCRIEPARVRLTVRCCEAITRQRCPSGLGKTSLHVHSCVFVTLFLLLA